MGNADDAVAGQPLLALPLPPLTVIEKSQTRPEVFVGHAGPVLGPSGPFCGCAWGVAQVPADTADRGIVDGRIGKRRPKRKTTVMTLVAVKPELPQPDIGSVLDVLAHRQPVELDCGASPTEPAVVEVSNRDDLVYELEARFPFQAHKAPITEKNRVGVKVGLVAGPPIHGEGENLGVAIRDFLADAVRYIDDWENHLRFGEEHQRYWGWVYRLLLAGDEERILTTLLDQPTE